MNTIEKIMQEQFKRRSFKYRIFFIGLLLEKYIFKYNKIENYSMRGTLLRNYYFLMRYLDDIIDGDVIIKNYYLIEDRIKYLEEKMNNLIDKVLPQDEIDILLYECHQQAKNIGFSLENESRLIISSLIFDGLRLSKWINKREMKIVTTKELEKHFYDLDITGTILGCLKIFDEDEKYIEDLYYLGTASRQYYDMRDFIEDIKKGLVNISFEDTIKYNITEKDINSILLIPDCYIDLCKSKSFSYKDIVTLLPESIFNYLIDRTKLCQEYLNKYNDEINKGNLINLRSGTKLTLSLGYEKSIKKHLNLINGNLNNDV